MSDFRIKVADCVIEINANYPLTRAICTDFIVDEEPDFRVTATQKDILYELQKTSDASDQRLDVIRNAGLESTALLRKISNCIIDYDTFLFHGAAIAFNNESYIFTGKSGIGKTTHILKWLENLSDAFIINGDKPFIKTYKDGKSPLACSSPWAGKENFYTNSRVPLRAIVILERGDDNIINRISFSDAFPDLFQQIYRPTSIAGIETTLALLKRLESYVQFYKFQVNNFKEDAFIVSYNTLIPDDDNN